MVRLDEKGDAGILMINTYVQISVTILVAAVIMLIIVILKKTATIVRALIILTMFLAGGGILGYGVASAGEGRIAVMQGDQGLIDRYYSAMYAQLGEYQKAIEIAEKHFAGDAQSLLLLARLNALDGNMSKAAVYYSEYGRTADGISVQDEAAYAGSAGGVVSTELNGVIRQYLEEQGLTAEEAGFPTYGNYESNAAAFGTREDFERAVLTRISEWAEEFLEDCAQGEQLEESGEWLRTVSMAYAASLNDEEYDEEELLEAGAELNRIVRRESALAANETLRNETLTANALLGDSRAVAKNIGRNATVSELAVAAELYIKGYAEEGFFDQFAAQATKTVSRQVSARCRDIQRAHRKELSDEEKEYYDLVIEMIQSNSDYALRNILALFSERVDAESDRKKSKLYLELAKGYGYVRQEDLMSNYIDLALENGVSSEDAQYADVMQRLLAIVTGESSEGIRSVSNYAREALEQIIPVPMDRFREEAVKRWKEEEKREKEEEREKEEGGWKWDEAAGSAIVLTAYDDAGESREDDFLKIFAEQVTKKRAIINIGQIDVTEYPAITARVSFGGELNITKDNIRDRINLIDCNYMINDYEVRKIENQQGKIILICDMSGSMSGDVGELKNAVRQFAAGMTENEEVAVVGFNNSIALQSGFLSDPEQVSAYADKIYANGGTSLYPTILAAGEMFSDDVLDNNIMIVMTDGQDGSRPTDAVLSEQIGALAAKHNCTVYTVGLGGVDEKYLTDIATIGNGQFLYADSADSLSSFYDFIHAQLANQYVVKFNVKDKVNANRTLRVELSHSIGNAEKAYRLTSDGAYTPEEYEKELNITNADELMVYGFKNSYLYMSKTDIYATICGANFSADTTYNIKLTGSLRSYPLTYSVVDSQQIEVTIPSTIAAGTYTLNVSTDSESRTVKDALLVAAPADQLQFKFGSYVFTAEKADTSSDGIVLSGNVVMNGWLYFKGDVSFAGDCRDEVSQHVVMTDRNGAYVVYSESGSTGIANLLAQKGINVPVPPMGSFEIYSESYSTSSYKNFTVKRIVLNAPLKISGVADIGATVGLYPDMIYSEAFYSQLDLKFLDQVCKNLPKNIFDKNMTGALAITNTCLAVKGSLELKYQDDNDTSKKFQLGSMGLQIKEFKVSLDTIAQEYSVEAEVGFEAFKLKKSEIDGFGLSLTWKEDGFDSFELSASGKHRVTIHPIPIYLAEVSIGASDLSGKKTAKELLSATVSGGFKLETDDIIEQVPKKVKEFFGMEKLLLAELDDARINVSLGKMNLNFDAKLKLLGIELAEGHIELGKIDYNNSILNIQCDEYGADVQLRIGVERSWKNLDVVLNGGAEVTLGFPFSGLMLDGEIGYDLRWFLFTFGKDLYGDFGIGILYNSNNEVQFIVKAYGQTDKGKTMGFRVDCSPSKGVQKKKY